ncbi:hypothetical protein OG203_33390 [Nocardia sp. NBC_01499]|uniref:hypothetical protein n=1 Tax=Nocardia sp. NBC_01499 TaxID=2903597 RepID=UPI00386CA7C8
MPAHQRVRPVIVALLGTVAVGALALSAPTATAAPSTATWVGVDVPLDGKGIDDSNPTKDKKADKAEKLGGTVTGQVIDLVTGIVKCGLNIATPAVKCDL